MSNTTVFESILKSLRDSDEGAREKGLQAFQDYVRSSLASGSSDDSETFWEEIISKVLLPLTMMSDTPQEKLVAIAAINKLLLSPSDDAHPTSAPASDSHNPSATSNPSAQRLLYRLLRYLKNLLPDPNLQVMEEASATYGTIFQIGGQTLAETVGEIEIQQAVRWMSETGGEWSGSASRASTIAQINNANASNPANSQSPQKKVEKEKILSSHARIAGVLVLTQIALHSPDLFYQNIELILSRIMYPLRDPSRFYVYTGSLGSGLVSKEARKDGAKDGSAIERSKPAYEARDVVRRIAARLFRVTLAVIALRESSQEGVETTDAANKISSAGAPALRGSSWKLDRIASQPLITPGSNASGSIKTNKPLMKVAAAASNDIANFILSASSSIDKDFLQSPHYQRIVQSQRQPTATGPPGTKSHPPQPVQGDINRAFGALLIYRELFDTKMANLAGVIATDPNERRRSYFGTAAMDDEHMRDLMGDVLDMRRHSMAGTAALQRGGIRYDSRVPSAVGGHQASSVSDVPSTFAGPRPSTSQAPSWERLPERPADATERPALYPITFSAIFSLATRHPTAPTHGTSLLGVSTHSIASLLAPSSPTTWSPVTPTYSFPSTSPLSPSGISTTLPEHTGVGWSSPLPPQSKYDQEEVLRKEALGMLPVCAEYDTERFRSGGFFRDTMKILMSAWGIEAYSSGSVQGPKMLESSLLEGIPDRNGKDSGHEVGGREVIPVEKGDRSYLVKVLGELTSAMRNSNAMLAYIWEIGVVLHGSLESRLPPPDPWRYNNYYSEAAIIARNAPPPSRAGSIRSSLNKSKANLVTDGYANGSAPEKATARDKKPRPKSTFVPYGQGLGGKNGREITMAKGSVNDEVLFDTIAVLSVALGVHIMKALGIAGRKGTGGDDSEQRDDTEDREETQAAQGAFDKMFRFGINPPLCEALRVIVENITPTLPTAQIHLLNEISTILSGHGYRPPGAPQLEATGTRTEAGVSVKGQRRVSSASPALVQLALSTLQIFNWHGKTLTTLIQEGVLPFIESPDRDIRLQACLSTCLLFMKDPVAHHTSTASVGVINEVLGQLIRTALTDEDSEIRASVLRHLDESYDKHLAQIEHVRPIAMTLNDEEPQVRLQGVQIIGRLARTNPANVMPGLRVELIKLLTELEYSTDATAILTTAEVLTALLKCTKRLLKPYVPSFLRVCLPKARSPLAYVSRRMIQCIGLLAQIAGEDILPSLDEIMGLLLATLQDPTASGIKKDIALVSLGQVCSNTGNVVEPYMKYPELFGILRGLLRGEAKEATKRKVLQVMGILGAVDPHARRNVLDTEVQEKPSAIKALQQSVKTVGAQPELFYQSVVIQALLGILSDASLAPIHTDVVGVILSIFKTQGMKCVPFLPQIIPAFTAMCRASITRHQDFYLQQISIIVQIVGSHIRNYIQDVFELTTELWANPDLHPPIVGLVEALSTSMAAEFKPYLPIIIPQLLKVFDEPPTPQRNATEVRVFHAMLSFGNSIEEYTHLVLPVLVKTAENDRATPQSRRAAVTTLSGLGRTISLAASASRIVQSLVRAIPTADTPLQAAIVDSFCVLLLQLGTDFAVFIPKVQKCIEEHGITSKPAAKKFNMMADKILKGEPLPQNIGMDARSTKSEFTDPVASADVIRFNVDQQSLQRYWSIEGINRQEDWHKWFKGLALGLMQESTSHALRACVLLADTHEPLAKELLNAAFYSCWVELTEDNQAELVQSLNVALRESRSTDIRLRLLSVIEFMEHEDKPLPISNKTLGDVAVIANALAKALHYKEHEFLSGPPTKDVVEKLIGIYTQLKQRDAALGLLHSEDVAAGIDQLLWYEQLGKWDQAYEKYQEKIEQWPEDTDAVMGKMRCLHALSEWDGLGQAMDARWPTASQDEREELAPMAAAAAWVLNDWQRMEEYVVAINADNTDRSFFKAILSVEKSQFDTAHGWISKARDALLVNLGPIDDYNRVYNTVVRVQLLSELEEIISYKKNADQPDLQQMMRKTWVNRLRGCQRDVDTWQRILQLRSLVIQPSEDTSSYIKFANLCRKEGRWTLAEAVIRNLLQDGTTQDGPAKAHPAVVFAHLKLLWEMGDQVETLGFLTGVCNSLAREIGLDDPRRVITGNLEEIQEIKRLLSKAYLRQGQWRRQLQPQWTPELIRDVVQCYDFATQLDPQRYKAWHTWALCNFDIIQHLENVEEDHDEEVQTKALLSHILAAIIGFFRSISLGGENPIQDSLRLLTLWFKFGVYEDVTATVAGNISTVPIETWLEVVPQLIARIQTPNPNVRNQINNLLTLVGRYHPQALIYPLTVASMSNNELRKEAATEIMNKLREHSANLVEQALTVSQELIRVAILWHELWHEYLEEASRLYFTEKRPDAMIAHLEILHKQLEKGPETIRETSFVQVHGKDLKEARDACMRYLETREITEMDKAWDIYYAVFRRIEKQLPLLTTIDLQYVSPKLLQAENLEIAVPGTYKSSKPVIRIARFVPKLSVIASKQRPRRLAIMGSDGKEYQYCLKGHEDLRQDERVMQVFSLVNTLLAADRQSYMRKLHIQGFAVVPLAPNVGLLRWVQHADTLHVLVSEYRQARKIHLQIEYRLMLQMAPDYVNLTMLQKLEVFKYALDNTTGQDLYRVLWLTSGDSESWLERRSTYTRSLAVSSMVGHILGLGDRHPANILIDQITGKVVHIDFGDCFEIAMHREKFPERIPFRLTRMLVSAMEVVGIEGSFKVTSDITMKVLRNNREPLMAVLEAFIYDPLVNWRLTTDADNRNRQATTTNVAGGDHGGAPAPGGRAGYTQYAGGPRRRILLNEGLVLNDGMSEYRNARALEVYTRVQKKLIGRDFNPDEELSVEDQVRKLIAQATALENLCQCFPGWCPFW